MGSLLDALEHAYQVLGLEAAAGGDEVFRDLVLARIIEPVSKLDSIKVLEEAEPRRCLTGRSSAAAGVCAASVAAAAIAGLRNARQARPGQSVAL